MTKNHDTSAHPATQPTGTSTPTPSPSSQPSTTAGTPSSLSALWERRTTPPSSESKGHTKNSATWSPSSSEQRPQTANPFISSVSDETDPTPPDDPAPERSSDDVKAAILAALQDIRSSAPAPDPTPEPPKPPEPTDYNTLFSEGRYDEAAEALKRDAAVATSTSYAPALAGLASAARELARQRHGDDWERWHEEAEKVAKELGYDASTFVDVKQWDEALKLAKARNLDTIIAEERDKAREAALRDVAAGAPPTLALGSQGSPATPEAATALQSLTPDLRSFVASMDLDPVNYARNQKVLETYVSDQGGYADVPVLDDDIPSTHDRAFETEIEPGAF